MEPKVQTITQLFEQQRRFVVPLFQRQYVWSLDEQWLPLWRDILRQIGKIIATGNDDNLPLDANHFMGAIVVQSESQGGADTLRTSTIIDGQQRLVTFQIILAVIRDHLSAMGSNFCPLFQSLTQNLPPHSGPDDKFKVWPTNKDRTSYQAAMSAHGIPQNGPGTPPLLQAYAFFAEALRDYIEAKEPDDIEDHDDPESIVAASSQQRVKALYQALSYSLRFVVIELNEAEDPQIIFESLNARGTPLLPSDLIKNYLFLEAGNLAQAAYDSYWKNFEVESWMRPIRGLEIRQLKSRHMIDVFFHTYLLMQPNRPEVDIDRLYIEFRDWRVKSRAEKPVLTLLDNISRHSSAFESLITDSVAANSAASRCVRAILATDDFVAMPLLVHLLARSLEAGPHSAVFSALESFVVRRWFCEKARRTGAYSHAQASLYGTLMAQVAAKDSDPDLEANFSTILRGLQQRGHAAWPTDDEFKRSWHSRAAYFQSRRERAVFILSALASCEQPKWANVAHGNLEIEHILPKGADENIYPFATPGNGYAANAELREALIDTIGNLTLLEKPLNQQAANQGFQAKRGVYQRSTLPLLGYVMNQARWSESEIKGRADDMFNIALAVWPRGPA
jgi:hypothetical protein